MIINIVYKKNEKMYSIYSYNKISYQHNKAIHENENIVSEFAHG